MERTLRTWLKVTIYGPDEAIDIAASFLADLTGSGVQTISENDAVENAKNQAAVGYLPVDDLLPEKQEEVRFFVNRLRTEFPVASEQIRHTSEPIEEEDWNRLWKTYFKPLRITDRLLIKPSWEELPDDLADLLVIELDPGLAFGTGHHASTQMALELLEEAVCPDRPGPPTVLDVGTGTGILAMACALYGAKSVLAIDNDPDAVTAAAANIRANALQSIITTSGKDLEQIAKRHDIVVANITADVLCRFASELTDRLAPGGTIVLSGILAGEQEEQTCTVYAEKGLRLYKRLRQGEWAALAFRSPTGTNS